MTQKSQLGNLGEDIACRYLIKKGFKILGRNYRKSWGEIDIIAKSLDKTLVFVEVKAMKIYESSAIEHNEKTLQPEDHLTQSKLQKIIKTAQLYVGQNDELINEKMGWRIDLLCVDFYENEAKYNIRHYENI